MAVDLEEASYWPTENLILKTGRKRFRVAIEPLHWQLRSLLSAEGNDTIYFPAGVNNTHITRLDTRTRETETIKILSFYPRCLVAKGGWICCGGELGEFAVIRDVGQMEGHEEGNPSGSAVDDALSNDFRFHLSSLSSPPGSDPSFTQFSRDMFNMLERRLNGPAKTWTVSNHKFGTERVNCITIWQPPKSSSPFPAGPGNYATPVAVLANNDKTVTFVGLQDCECLDELQYPDCVNRGVLSPDGTMLASICDDPFLYIHVRRVVSRGKTGEVFEWKMLPPIRLKSQRKDDSSDCRGSFAASFSPSGRYLAVGTQYGTISIFDVAALRDPDNTDPMVTFFNAAQFPQDEAAVRDMAFCPGPYDLLVWTEHRGRVGIADARTRFTQRQIISLSNHDDLEHLAVNDRNTIDPRLLEHRSERNMTTGPGSSSHLSSLLNQTSSPRPLPNPEPSDATDRLNHPFTPEETAILEAVQNDRRRREAREAREQRDHQVARGSAAWRSSVWAERVSVPSSSMTSLRSTVDQEDREADLRALGIYRDIAHTLRQQREALTRVLDRERNRDARDLHRQATTNQSNIDQDRERRAPTPRRRSSIMQALTQNVDNFAQVLNRTQAPGDNETSGSRDSSGPWVSSRLTAGWADLAALYDIGTESSNPNEGTRAESSRARRAIPVISDVWNDDLGGFGIRRNNARTHRDHNQHADDTAGLTWSEDGQILYIGAEDGIYEFHINLQGRKVFPDMTLR
ncbi:uncharacterized protein BCR38DRAFT_218051 [Pseudomassariella vexata]|uniref:DUF2415 domain-containing protein n=1 Tax=Pseudomassariella vexata TaxID=1141098 RepID=A0A1Y2DUX9_9PEZI|nr:uncharacterized protein BCR38DRAFT_218051 [Pseudomassariella vexata]ORY62946.1 hypothetical protein BCR38DRAFT_218051 [Pseudomassariella vexata]